MQKRNIVYTENVTDSVRKEVLSRYNESRINIGHHHDRYFGLEDVRGFLN